MSNSLSDIIINETHLKEYDELDNIQCSKPFSEDVIDFLNDLSKILFSDKRSKEYPDVTTFAFFCRKANILKLKNDFMLKDEIRLGRGIVFHIAPSNVPINFAYSLISGLLSGNINILRLPTKDFIQVQIIIDAINKMYLKNKYHNVMQKIVLIRYKSENEEITKILSSKSAIRMIWGGDNTIANIKKHKTPPRSIDIAFADRYSICVIESMMLLKENNIHNIITGFYNDTFLFDQNACTSPHLVIWLGSDKNVKKAQNLLWENLKVLANEKYNFQNIQATDKITTFFNHAISSQNISLIDNELNILWRVKLKKLESFIENYRSNGGYFYEYHAKSLNEISAIANSKYQTMTYYGLNKKEISEFILNQKPMGIDRIVPIGKASEFSFNWDGFNLIDALSRIVDFKD